VSMVKRGPRKCNSFSIRQSGALKKGIVGPCRWCHPNPRVIAKERARHADQSHDLRTLGWRSQAESVETEANAMIRQGKGWGPRFTRPCGQVYSHARWHQSDRDLSKEGIRVNVPSLFFGWAGAVARQGRRLILSPFVGSLDDIGQTAWT